MHFPEFIETTLDKDYNAQLSCSELRGVYEKWCSENKIQDAKSKRMETWFSNNAEKYGMKYSRTIVRNGRQVRGYCGVKIKDEWQSKPLMIK